MKILVIGGMHGNEPLGIALVKSLAQEPIDNEMRYSRTRKQFRTTVVL